MEEERGRKMATKGQQNSRDCLCLPNYRWVRSRPALCVMCFEITFLEIQRCLNKYLFSILFPLNYIPFTLPGTKKNNFEIHLDLTHLDGWRFILASDEPLNTYLWRRWTTLLTLSQVQENVHVFILNFTPVWVCHIRLNKHSYCQETVVNDLHKHDESHQF